jgi:SAM-dependent methyltransferase
MLQILQNLWKRAILRGIHYRDRHERFDQLYRIEDPWHMNTEAEQFRFLETNRLIEANFGRVKTMLEVGCGEGHQSAKLSEICGTLYAIDISARAIERASRRCRKVQFSVGDIFSAPILKTLPEVDLVVACEVLYYMRDLESVIRRMEQLGRWCLVTYIMEQDTELGPALAPISQAHDTTLRYNDLTWRAVWWKSRALAD